MKRILFTVMIVFIAGAVDAQDEMPPKLFFRSINLVGGLAGAQTNAAIVQSVNGVAYKKWSTGIGVGIDGYGQRSIPLFIDLRRSFGKGYNKAFVYVDGGINFAWLNFIQRENESFPDYKQPCWYYDAGLGWKIPLATKTSFIISAGFSLKQLEGERTSYGPPVGGRPIEYKESFENTYRRLSIKLGVEL